MVQVTQHYTDEELVAALAEDPVGNLDHLSVCESCAERATMAKGILAALSAWTIDDHEALVSDMAPAAKEIRDFLHEAYALECEVVGDEVVEDISFGRTQFVTAVNAEHFPVTGVIASMVAAANFVAALLVLREELERVDASKESLEENLSALKATHSDIDTPRQELAIRRMFPGHENFT